MPAEPSTGKSGRPRSLQRRVPGHDPVPVKDLALALALSGYHTVSWREGTRTALTSRFAALRVRASHRDYWRATPRDDEWLLIEWPVGESEPTKYWLSTLPEDTPVAHLVHVAKMRRRIERDYQDLKQEFGLGPSRGVGGVAFIITHPCALQSMVFLYLNHIRDQFSNGLSDETVELHSDEAVTARVTLRAALLPEKYSLSRNIKKASKSLGVNASSGGQSPRAVPEMSTRDSPGPKDFAFVSS